MSAIFSHLKSYATFLLQHHLDALVKDTIEKAKRADLPVLKLLANYSEEEIFQLSKKGFAEGILLPISRDTPFEEIKKGIKAWKANATIIPKEQLNIADITAINNTRKHALLDFIKYYDCSKDNLIHLVKEIEVFFETCIDMGLKAYEEIQRAELINKNEIISGILSNIPVIVTRLDKEGNIIFSAGAGLQSLGFKDNELSGKNIFDLYPNAGNTKAALEGKLVSFTGMAKSISGEMREFQTFYIPEEHGALGFSVDITEKREIEKQFRRLVEGVKDYSIFIIDSEGKIISWNKGAERLKGYAKEEILGKHISIFYTEEKKSQNYAGYGLEQAKKFGKFEDEGIRIRKDGSTFYANVIITPLYDNNNILIGFSKITRDLTERKLYEENLQNLNIELEEKVKARTEELLSTIQELKKINNDLDNFIYTASHDLKAPISNIEGLILGLYEELGEEIESNANLRTFKEMIDSSIKRFQNTITELTEIAKIQKGDKENIEEIDLSELLEDVKITIDNLIKKNDAEIIFDFNGCVKTKFVRKNLKSIFYNIISNGIKYRRPDRRPVINIKYSIDKEFETITFEDNGLGIKDENKEKIFSMFKRFHDHVEGSGVGLYIVKRIIENEGGKIEVQSEEGKGSVFKVFLPKI